MNGAIEYAKHAAKNGADAIVSLPPEKAEDRSDARILQDPRQGHRPAALRAEHRQHERRPDRGAHVQRNSHHERGEGRSGQSARSALPKFANAPAAKLNVFSGNGVRTMITEMERGLYRACPTTGLSDIYAQASICGTPGKKREGFDMFGRVLAFDSIPECGFVHSHRARRI